MDPCRQLRSKAMLHGQTCRQRRRSAMASRRASPAPLTPLPTAPPLFGHPLATLFCGGTPRRVHAPARRRRGPKSPTRSVEIRRTYGSRGGFIVGAGSSSELPMWSTSSQRVAFERPVEQPPGRKGAACGESDDCGNAASTPLTEQGAGAGAALPSSSESSSKTSSTKTSSISPSPKDRLSSSFISIDAARAGADPGPSAAGDAAQEAAADDDGGAGGAMAMESRPSPATGQARPPWATQVSGGAEAGTAELEHETPEEKPWISRSETEERGSEVGWDGGGLGREISAGEAGAPSTSPLGGDGSGGRGSNGWVILKYQFSVLVS